MYIYIMRLFIMLVYLFIDMYIYVAICYYELLFIAYARALRVLYVYLFFFVYIYSLYRVCAKLRFLIAYIIYTIRATPWRRDYLCKIVYIYSFVKKFGKIKKNCEKNLTSGDGGHIMELSTTAERGG